MYRASCFIACHQPVCSPTWFLLKVSSLSLQWLCLISVALSAISISIRLACTLNDQRYCALQLLRNVYGQLSLPVTSSSIALQPADQGFVARQQPLIFTQGTCLETIAFGAVCFCRPPIRLILAARYTRHLTRLSVVTTHKPQLSMTMDLLATRTKFGERAFSHAGPAAWNSIPDKLRQAPTFNGFKRNLKTHLFSTAFTF